MEWAMKVACSVVLLLALACSTACARAPGDSSSPAFSGPGDRVAWMAKRIRGGAPSAMRDAHFLEEESTTSGGHMGPGRTMYWFYAKIEIDPADAPAWAARVSSAAAPHWQREANPMHQPGRAWSMDPADFDSARWYDPAPLFDPAAQSARYRAGHMAITDAGTNVYVWQHWR